jgi:hypothetical protein
LGALSEGAEEEEEEEDEDFERQAGITACSVVGFEKILLVRID